MSKLVIGIAGGTGSGKTTVAKKLTAELPAGSVSVIEHDSYYKDRADHLSLGERAGLNFDHPDALETELLVEHLAAMKAGKPVNIPIYDYKTHRRLPETRRVEPTPAVVVEVILVFVDPRLRDML